MTRTARRLLTAALLTAAVLLPAGPAVADTGTPSSASSGSSTDGGASSNSQTQDTGPGVTPTGILLPADATGILLLSPTGAQYPVLIEDGTPDAVHVRMPIVDDGEYTLTWDSPRGPEIRSITAGTGTGLTPPAWRPATAPGREAGGLPIGLLIGVLVAAAAVGGLGTALALKRRNAPIAAAALACSAALVLTPVALTITTSPTAATRSVTAIGDCSQLTGTGRVQCAAGALLTAYDIGGAPQLRTLLASLQGDPAYADGPQGHACHEAAHLAGRALIEAGVPLAQAVTGEAGECGMGLLHGGVEAYARTASPDTLAAGVRDSCESIDTTRAGPGQEQNLIEQCAHGTGHAAAYRHGGRIEPALQLCAKAYTDPLRAGACAGGAGMVAMSRYTTLAGGAGDPTSPGAFDAYDRVVADPSAPARACETVTGEARARCWDAMLGYLDPVYGGSERLPAASQWPGIAEYCREQDTPGDQASCMHGVGAGLVGTSPAPAVAAAADACTLLPDDSERIACLAGAIARRDGLGIERVDETERGRLCRVISAADIETCVQATNPGQVRELYSGTDAVPGA